MRARLLLAGSILTLFGCGHIEAILRPPARSSTPTTARVGPSPQSTGPLRPELSAEDKARVPADLGAPYPGEVLVTAPAGSAIICNSSMWHAGTLKKGDDKRRMLHLTYTRRDLPQQLVQVDHLTPALYERMAPVHRYLLEIEPRAGGDEVLRQPKRDHKGWWN